MTFPAVFLDRDGTLVRDVRHAVDPAQFELLPGVVEALRALSHFGYRLVVVSNQSGVARGLFTLGEARLAARYLAGLLAAADIRLAGYYLCPHHPDGSVPGLAIHCDCRKPAPGLLLRAAKELSIDLPRSWMVGDMESDVGAGDSSGVRSIFIDTGHSPLAPTAGQYLVARNLAHAAAMILAADGHLPPTAVPPRDLADPRRATTPDQRRTGEASEWPSPEWMAVARGDGEWLEEVTGRSATPRMPGTDHRPALKCRSIHRKPDESG
jgi:D-glycero-D-manno-heptose 1,7-bisphosphate phosphatase